MKRSKATVKQLALVKKLIKKMDLKQLELIEKIVQDEYDNKHRGKQKFYPLYKAEGDTTFITDRWNK